MPLAIWAETLDVPGHVCRDARLGGKAGPLDYPEGTPSGQAGWDVGFQFSSLADLADKLYRKPIELPSHVCGRWVRDCAPIRKGEVSRLAIHVHGLPGVIFPSGQKKPDLALRADNVATYHQDLHDIGLATREDATILIVGCLAGQGPQGTAFLKALAKVWPGRRVVGFSTIGFVSAGDMMRGGEGCINPGMRDTEHTSAALSWEQQQRDYGPIWKDLRKLPWASGESPHAKVVLGDSVLRGEKM